MPPAATRSAKTRRSSTAEVDRYYAAGVFNTSAAPNRPLNPDRDFNTTSLTSDEGELMRADLLTPASAAHLPVAAAKPANKSPKPTKVSAMLAMREQRPGQRREPYMEAARKAGTHNFVALTDIRRVWTDDPARAIEILKEALTIDPKYAEAHWVFGEKLSDPARRMAEWKQAVNLAPRNYEWWAQYAQLCVDQKQYAEAGRAWMAAAQAAPDAQLREQYLARARPDRAAAPRCGRRRAAQRSRGESARNRPPEKGGAQGTGAIWKRAPTRIRCPPEEAAKAVELVRRCRCIGRK